MCIRQMGRTLSVIAAVVGGIVAAAVFYYVEDLETSILFWVALVFSAVVLLILLTLTVAADRRELTGYLRQSGVFWLLCLAGSVFLSALGLALAPVLPDFTTSLPALLLLFLIGFCLTGALAGLVVYLVAGDEVVPQAPNPCGNTMANTIVCR